MQFGLEPLSYLMMFANIRLIKPATWSYITLPIVEALLALIRCKGHEAIIYSGLKNNRKLHYSTKRDIKQ